MSDFAKCNGEGCAPRASCRRFTCKPSKYQSYAAFDSQRVQDVISGITQPDEPCIYFIAEVINATEV